MQSSYFLHYHQAQVAQEAQAVPVVQGAVLRILPFLMLRPDPQVPWVSSGGFDKNGRSWALH